MRHANTFDGRAYTGYAGDTLASALLANGIHLTGRSFKYHRPRGIFGSWADEPNALVTIERGGGRRTPNLPATQVELYDGLVAVSQNRYPTLERDVRSINDRLSRFLPAGFYYKTFMWPRRAWAKFYEPHIRAAAGLGVAPQEEDPDRYAQRYAHCDILVVGGGPAGLAAAREAARAGCRVILCDERPELGGSLLAAAGACIDGAGSRQWVNEVVAELDAMPDVTLLRRTSAFGYYPHNLVGLSERLTDHRPGRATGPRERLWQVRAREVILATGAIERPLVFPDNDRPGVMLADAARTYLQQYGVAVGRRIVLVTAHDAGYRTAHELHAAGIDVVVADVRGGDPAKALPFPVLADARIEGTTGRLRVKAVVVTAGGRTQTLRCDALLMCGGWTPSIHLASQSRAALVWDPELEVYLPGTAAEAERSAGAGRGRFELGDALADGAEAGAKAAAAAGFCGGPARAPYQTATPHPLGEGGMIGALEHKADPARVKAFVDWQNDVTARDIHLAAREGFRSIEHVKRYTTTGMATDQGKLSNLNALGIVAAATGRTVPQIGLTTFRAPYTPVTFGTLAATARGDLFEPLRLTPSHDWAVAAGAVFEDVGQWRRARYFPQGRETMDAAVSRECAAVRRSAGIFDASTLGKIEVVGPDAAEFLNRLYINAWTKLAPGRCRYGVLLRDDGFIFDDGIVGRLAEDRFHVTTTTTGAARVLAMMEDYLQTEWSDLDVWLTSTTEQWAVIALQGPEARAILAPLVQGIDISAGAFPHMSIGEGHILGVPMRLMRVSFTGEIGFEINVPSGFASQIWQAIWDRGQNVGLTSYGTEAMHVLRAEKGYIIVGQESDGTVTPHDAGLSWAIGKAKPDFVGKRSLDRPAMQAGDRKELVGLLCDPPGLRLEEGAQLIEPGSNRSAGHVTSSYFSPALGRSIALALVKGGRGRTGERLRVTGTPEAARAIVVDPVFIDPEGVRISG